MTTRATSLTALAALGLIAASAQATSPPPGAPAPKDHCGGNPRCFDAGAFVAEVMQLSASAMTPGARHQGVVINIRFRNVSDKPVILAYRAGSSQALDNFGNGFTWGRPGTHDTSVKGIGMLEGRSVDTQFGLNPGQARSATFNIIRFNARPPIGNAWNYDVVIDEIEILPGQVVRSARQNSLSFPNLTAGTFSANANGASPLDALGGTGTAPADGTDVANKVIDIFNRVKNSKKN
jgi:hypothetical protein